MNSVNVLSYASTNVTTGAYVQVVASTPIPCTQILISDTSGKILKLAVSKPVPVAATSSTLTNQSITYTARAAGYQTNSIQIELVDPDAANKPMSVNVVGNKISVQLKTGSAVAASVVIQDLTYTAVAAGDAGNNIAVTYTNPLANSQPLTVNVVGNAINVLLATNGGGTITSTATLVKAAIDASTPAHALVSVAISGTGSNVQAAAASTPLVNGANGALTAIASDVVSAIAANNFANSMVSASSGSPSTSMIALVATALSGASNITSGFSANEDLFQLPITATLEYTLGSTSEIPVGSKLLLRAIDASATTGYNVITLLS